MVADAVDSGGVAGSCFLQPSAAQIQIKIANPLRIVLITHSSLSVTDGSRRSLLVVGLVVEEAELAAAGAPLGAVEGVLTVAFD